MIADTTQAPTTQSFLNSPWVLVCGPDLGPGIMFRYVV